MRIKVASLPLPLAITLFAVSITPHLLAQSTSGTLIGTIQDSSGSTIPGAAVSVTNVGTNVTTAATSNESGNYTVAELTPGTYTVTFTKPGFQKFIQQNVAVNVGQSARVDGTLQVGRPHRKSPSRRRRPQSRAIAPRFRPSSPLNKFPRFRCSIAISRIWRSSRRAR